MDVTVAKLALLTIPEVAQEMRCGETVVKKLIASGTLRASKVAGKWLIERADMTAYVAAQSNRPKMATRRRLA